MVNPQPKVSVIVPVYRVEPYLDACVGSIVKQTYPHLEIILVDDGSPDACGAMCDAWAQKDPRVKVIHQANGGLSAARNAGLNVVTGEYLMFVDSDDRLNAQSVAILVSGILEQSGDLAVCSWRKIYDIDHPADRTYTVTSDQWQCFTDDAVFDLLFNHQVPLIMAAWAKLYRTTIFEKLRFPTTYTNHEDEYLIHYVLAKVKKLCFINLPLYDNLQRKTSITGTVYTKSRLLLVKAHRDRWDFCQQHRPQFAQKALGKYLTTLAVSYTRFKAVHGDRAILQQLLDEFHRCYPQLRKKSLFVRLFQLNRPVAGLVVKIRDKIKG